jgi:hypothetical protein
MNFKKGDIIELEIHDMAFGGKGISRVKTEDGDSWSNSKGQSNEKEKAFC